MSKKSKDLPQSASRAYFRLMGIVKRYWSVAVLGVVATVMVSVVDSGLTWLIKPIINKGFITQEHTFIHWLPLILIGAVVFRTIANFASNYFVARLARSVVMNLRQMVFKHLLKLPAEYYDARSSGKILSIIIYNIDQVADASSNSLVIFLREGALLIGMLVVMFSLSWELSLILLIITPLLLFIVKICSRRLRKLSHSVQSAMGDVTQVAEEGIEGYRVIRMNGSQEHEDQKFTAATRYNRHRQLKIVVTNSLNNGLIQLIIAVPAIGFIAFSVSSFAHITAGGFAAMITALFALMRPIRQLGKFNAQIQRGIAGAESVFELLDQEVEHDDGQKTIDSRLSGKIVFDQVTFNYAGVDKPALSAINFSVNPGETVALVGKSGAGKSTIMQLIPRFYLVSEGKITIDDADINEYELSDLREQISLVSQKTILFNGTIEDNIAYGNLEASRDQIIKAAQAAHVMEFVEKMPSGLDTMVGDDGVLLSGGQRQRIAIARALIKDAPILLLDEATSALDTHSERHIQEALENLTADRTTLVVAHRLSTIEKADRIVVLDQGKIVEMGDHATLLAKGAEYAQLYKMQFGQHG